MSKGGTPKKEKPLEKNFQKNLKKELKNKFDGAYVLKLDPQEVQGIPDLLILHKDKWAALEVKRSEDAPHRPNQDYRVKKINDISFARFISPENKESVLDELEEYFK